MKRKLNINPEKTSQIFDKMSEVFEDHKKDDIFVAIAYAFAHMYEYLEDQEFVVMLETFATAVSADRSIKCITQSHEFNEEHDKYLKKIIKKIEEN